MTFASFVLSFGSLMALMVVASGWVLRTSAAPMAIKIIVPAAAMGLACYAPIAVSAMMGFPVNVAGLNALPDRAQLVAFVPHDEDKRVDLWLIAEGAAGPRSYETVLDEQMKKTLRAAQEAMAQGRPAMLTKQGRKGQGKGDGDSDGKSGAHDGLAIGSDDSMYVLDPSVMSSLPPKD